MKSILNLFLYNLSLLFQQMLLQFHQLKRYILYFMNKISFLVLLLLAASIQTQKYKKIVHKTDPDARCLDGSPPALYVHQGSQTNKFLIFLEGGGFCQGQTQAQTIEQCYQRSKTILGSSNLWPDQLQAQGYLSTLETQSHFANWTKFIFAYCDGSLHQGHRASPIQYKNATLYFRGSKIIKAQFAYLQQNYQISKAEKIVWTGGSAGAVGAYLWSGYLKKLFPKQNQLYTIVDSGVFLDFPAHGTQNHHFATQLRNMYQLANLQQSTPIELCNEMNLGSEWKCLLLQYNFLYRQKNENILYINSQYDTWAVENILKIKCLTKSSISTAYTLDKCNKQEMDAIQKYRDAYQLLMLEVAQISKASLWSIACSNHVYACLIFTYQSEYYRIPEMNGATVRKTVEDFVLNGKEKIANLDLLPWPNNHPCAI